MQTFAKLVPQHGADPNVQNKVCEIVSIAAFFCPCILHAIFAIFTMLARPSGWSKPAVDWSKPAVDWSKPAVDWSKPVVDWSKPAVDWSKPAVYWSKPVVDWSKPAVDCG